MRAVRNLIKKTVPGLQDAIKVWDDFFYSVSESLILTVGPLHTPYQHCTHHTSTTPKIGGGGGVFCLLRYALAPTRYAPAPMRYALAPTRYALAPTRYALAPMRYALAPMRKCAQSVCESVKNPGHSVRGLRKHISA